MHVLFVCTGNTCRSPMAEGYFKYLLEKEGVENITASSAGTFAAEGVAPSRNAVMILEKFGIDISDSRSTPVTASVLGQADLIITMTGSHQDYIGRIDSSALKRTKRLGEYSEAGNDIPDPFGGGPEIYEACFLSMKAALDTLFKEIRQK